MKLLDTCVWVALLNEKDSTHQKALKIACELKKNELQIFDFIYTEAFTVLRFKSFANACVLFKDMIASAHIDINFTDTHIIKLAEELFFYFKKLSFTDCLLMATCKLSKSSLVTFDKNLQKAWNIIEAR